MAALASMCNTHSSSQWNDWLTPWTKAGGRGTCWAKVSHSACNNSYNARYRACCAKWERAPAPGLAQPKHAEIKTASLSQSMQRRQC